MHLGVDVWQLGVCFVLDITGRTVARNMGTCLSIVKLHVCCVVACRGVELESVSKVRLRLDQGTGI